MIPIQDVVPTGRTPVVTLALIVVNVIVFAAQWVPLDVPASIPFAHADIVHFLAAILFLWIFGDHVEARLGGVPFLLLYLLCGVGATQAALLLSPFLSLPQTAAAFAVTGVLGAYLLLLPQSRVLVLVPAPVVLAELPAWFLAGLWALLQVSAFVTTPRALPVLLASLAVAGLSGALFAMIARRPIRW